MISDKIIEKEFFMELVYLWVEDYKNIKKQGFNFSPNFECDFKPIYEEDENGRSKISDESKPLVIYKENLLKNIFDKNINITAIIGQNGSGKSSIFEYLLNKRINSNIVLSQDFDEEIDNILWIYDSESDTIIKMNQESLLNTNIILYNEDIDSKLYQSNYNTNKYLENNFSTNNREDIHNIIISYYSHVENLEYLSDLNFLPTHIELNLLNTITKFENLYGIQIQIDNYFDSYDLINISNSEIERFNNFLEKELNTQIHNFNVSGDIKNYLFIREFIYKLSRNHRESINIFKEIVINKYTESNFINKIEKELFSNQDELVFNLIIQQLDKISKNREDDKFIINLSENDLIRFLKNSDRNFFEIKFFKEISIKDRIYFSDLSSGEQKIIILFSKLYYLISKNEKKDILILFDEPDNYLHPNWQKKLISYILSFFKNTKLFDEKKINILISSHSPFILADLPKENVIFLEKGKQVYPFDDGKQTFGANIHTLLSHGFFMKNGLMGEFAKNKINDVINFLNGNKSLLTTNDEAQNLINIIGEPIIKKQLQKMLDSKRLSKIDEIDLIKNQMKELSKRLEEIENAKD